MGHPVTQWQILSRDPEKHSAFYADVFGWGINGNNPMGYRQADTGGMPGGFWPAPPEAHSFVQLFVEVADMNATIKKVTEKGGSVMIPPQTLPAGEQMAILRDPLGITFGVSVPAKKK